MLIGYAQASTVAGLAAQEAALGATGCRKLFSEQASSVAQRGQLDAVLDFVREGDTLVVTRLDRVGCASLLPNFDCSIRAVVSAARSLPAER